MKKSLLLIGLISLFLASTANAQIVTKYQQGFEASGETSSYTVVQGSATPVSNISSSGNRCLKIQHTSQETIIMLDTLDFTDNGSLQYFYLEFMHICDVNPLSTEAANSVAIVEMRRTNESEWTQMDGNNHYDNTWGGGSENFVATSTFSNQSYSVWRGSALNGTWFKRERFKLAMKLTSRPLQERKLLIRFRLKSKVTSGTSNQGWYLDNIKVQCSPNSMLLPVMNMVDYPDGYDYPSSRNTHLAATFTTPLAEGMCNDSVYVVYQLGRAAQVLRRTMTPVSGAPGKYETYLPFCGYDTVVRWRVIGRDNSVNHNMTNFPADISSWMEYKCVRGKDINATISGETTGGNTDIPFPHIGDNKCEMVYDSAEMAALFGPSVVGGATRQGGAITQLRFPVASSVTNSVHNRITVRMSNVKYDYAFTSDNEFFSDFQKLVYDSSLVITQNANTYGTINLQDTFFYAGKGLRISITNDNLTSEPSAVSVRTFSAPSGSVNKGTITIGYPASEGFDPFNSSYFLTGQRSMVRPNWMIKLNGNPPLQYDCGISGFINPNDSTPANAVGNNDVVVTLRNYGTQTINAVRIYYSVDNGVHQYYDWSGSLAGGAATNVTINTTQTYAAGYHEMLAWVDDSVLVSGQRYRDHEPFNDTLWTRFISCDGPMSGVRTVGGSVADYQGLEKLLFALSQCGVNGPLTVKLAPGYYRPHTFPTIPGTSETNYVQFEPLSGSVTFVSAMTDTAWVNSLVNLQKAHHIRFNNINFMANAASNPATYLVRMGTNSVGCQFLNCTFTDVQGGTYSEDYMDVSALLYSGGADSLTVRNCTFNRGNIGLSLVGPAQDNMARGSRVEGNLFQNQGTNSMVIRNQINAIADSNTCNRLYANSSYAILLQDCSGATRVTRNTVYVTSGASCIGATQLFGSPSGYAIVANNMLVSADDGASNMLTTPLNIITADYTKVLYNSIKLTAPTRTGIAAATFGGGVLSNSLFYNNIVACMDTVNFAFSFIPTEDSVNYIGYNIYYSHGPVLNKYDGINCYTMNNWLNHCGMDGNSQNVNPAFLNYTLTDLRSYSQNVKSHGVPIAEVTNDMFGTVRDAVAPCVGAFEFAALPYDFEILEFLEPFADYCDASNSVPLRVVIKNSGVNSFDPSTAGSSLQLAYNRGTSAGVMLPNASGNIIINRVIPPTDTIILNTNVTIPFPPNGMRDTTYSLYAWLTSLVDPNPANDTTMMTVTSRYHAPAPTSITTTSNYGTSATVTATGGLQTWSPNTYGGGALHQSVVYWYLSPNDDTPIWRGSTFTTDPLYNDTTFYIRQKRDYPLVRITEVQVKPNNPGATYPMPLWINSSTVFAVELTNVGDYPAVMTNDTIMLVSNTSSMNNKIYKFPNVTIQPGATLVMQYRAGINNVDSTRTLGAGVTINSLQNSNIGIIYKTGGAIVDAVAINNVTAQTQWTSKNVPASVWNGAGIMLPPDSIPTAGVIRTAWPGSGSMPSENCWMIADDSHRMTLGKTNTNLIRFVDNGCIGEASPVQINMINLPDVDIALDDITLNDGCGMGMETLTVGLHNRGSQPSGQLVVHYRVDGYPQYTGQAIQHQTCSDTITAGLTAQQGTNHTFSVTPDFTVQSASVDFDVTVWVEKLTTDNTNFNDTVTLSVTSMFAPDTANVIDSLTIMYGERATLQSLTPPADSLAWYDRDMNIIDTCNVFVSDYLYIDDTFFVSAMGAKLNPIHVGTLASVNNATAYPSPYNPNKKYDKEQYLFLASELIDAGHQAGPIQTVAFYLDTIMHPNLSMTFTDYVISIGTTSQTAFTANNNWLPVTPYYSASSLTLTRADKGWVTHNLDSAFHWNGTDNIVVQITRTIASPLSQGAKTRFTNAGAQRVLQKQDANNDVATFTGNGSRSTSRPDIRFGFVDYGCEGPRKAVTVRVEGTPESDGALSWTLGGNGTDTTSFNSCGLTNLNVVVKNMGSNAFSNYTIDYWIDTLHGVYNGTTAIGSRESVVLTVAQHQFSPGRHSIMAILTLANDTVPTNDTIRRTINVRFCAGNYPIGPVNGMYPDFTTAIDTLMNAGVDGAVVFDVEPGVYVEQLTLSDIAGVSATNTVTFRGTQNQMGDVLLRYAPTQTENYVVNLDGARHIRFEWMTIVGRGSANYSNAVWVRNSRDIHFSHDNIRVKANLNNINASCIVIDNEVSAFYVDNSVLDSGYYSIRGIVTGQGATEGVYITENTLRSFMVMGVNIRNANDVYIYHNTITSGASSNSKPLTGVFVAQHEGPLTIERNNIVLYDAFNGAKQGIKIINVNGANAMRSMISNNMCAIYGNTNGSSAGIWIDSCTWVNVYFNSCRVYAGLGNQNQNTRAMSVGTTSSEIFVMNNAFVNDGFGYALYVQLAANIANCNYNDYFSAKGTRLAYWGGVECPTLGELQQTNSMDNNSLNTKPYFISNADLHYSTGTLCEKAQYNTGVPNDIDGVIRPQIPSPCIGAHEFLRKNHNIAAIEIYSPTLETDNVETDTLWIKVKLTNDGTSTESNLRWWAEIEGSNPLLRTTDRIIDEMLPQEDVIDSNYIVMPIGVIDTHTIIIYFPMVGDSVPENNVLDGLFFLDPAYNFRAKSVIITDATGCRLHDTPVSVELTNVGRKTFPAGTMVPIGFQAVLQTTGVTVSTLPTSWVDTVALPMDVEANADVTLNFIHGANLYPTGIAKDIVVRARAWSSYQHDQKPLNDTTSFTNHTSKFTPSAPVGVDLNIPYATWDTIFASQTDIPPTGAAIHRPIFWFRDSTEAHFFTANNYTRSCWWETPQYFHDSVYFLNCVSTTGCTSYYSAVHVNINPRVPVDMAVLDVVEPVGNRVYMTNDSVKLALINYGSQPVTNIPVVYELYNSSNVLMQHVVETCTATIQPDEVYVFRFDSLITIPQWSTNAAYHLRVWTDMPNENVRLNDTLRDLSYFYAVPDNVYPAAQVANRPGLDITRVAVGSLDNSVSPAGHDYINFVNASMQNGAINTPQTLADPLPDYGGSTDVQGLGTLRALRVVKGLVDTMIVECESSDKSSDVTTYGNLSVWIDMNRDGDFTFEPLNTGTDSANYLYPYTEIIHTDTIVSNRPAKFLFTLPPDIRTGYMRMRVVVEQGVRKPSEANADFQFGSVQDFLLYVEDAPQENIDICAARIVSPREQHIGGHTGYTADSAVSVKFQVANKGRQAVDAVEVTYVYSNQYEGVETGTVNWTGDLAVGGSAVIELPERIFGYGVTDVIIAVTTMDDTNTINDTLYYQYFKPTLRTLVFSDDFEGRNDWFIPRGSNPYTVNLWERGHSHKPNIMACISDSCVLATNINGLVNAFNTGNVSYAYTPIFDISVLRPDTLDLWVARDMAQGHLARIEFCDYLGRWQTVGTGNDTLWYNSGDSWDSTSFGYELMRFSLNTIGSEFQQRLQLRLVYKAEVESNSCDGIAIDDFVVGRARRNLDVGVIAITHPTHPKFGQTINPRVVIKNYGLDTIYNVTLAYKPYGVNLAKTGEFVSESGIKPGETALFEFSSPFVVMNDFPDTFQICAYTTVNMDLYKDNDSVCSDFYLSPLDNDMGIVSFLSPNDRVIAGDSITVTARIRNFGQAPVSSTDITYIYNEQFVVTEHIDFEATIGHELQSFEYLNYSFRQKFRASMGVMHVMAYLHMPNDDYLYNDTIMKSIDGLSAITDLRARAVIVDTSRQGKPRIHVIVENVGARAVNDFHIGTWYYRDTTTLMDTLYHAETPLPALSTLYFEFPKDLPNIYEYYNYVTAYVYAEEDNDRSNDTTDVIESRFVDLRPVRVLVEENMYDSCRVRIEMENIGNTTSRGDQVLRLSAVINGQTVSVQAMRAIAPGTIATFNFNDKILKSPTRTYVGSGTLTFSSDGDLSNNQTTNVVVLNYFEGVPVVNAGDGMLLEQNYPNPFDNSTVIKFYLPSAGNVRFFVVDEMGRMVYNKEQLYSGGDHSISFKADNLSAGVYYYGIEKDGQRLMRKMVRF